MGQNWNSNLKFKFKFISVSPIIIVGSTFFKLGLVDKWDLGQD